MNLERQNCEWHDKVSGSLPRNIEGMDVKEMQSLSCHCTIFLFPSHTAMLRPYSYRSDSDKNNSYLWPQL